MLHRLESHDLCNLIPGFLILSLWKIQFYFRNVSSNLADFQILSKNVSLHLRSYSIKTLNDTKFNQNHVPLSFSN